MAVFLADLGDLVRASRRVAVLTDERDNQVLACAVAGEADVVVTGDREMLRLRRYQGIPIVSLRDYLESAP